MSSDAHEPMPCSGRPCPDGCEYPVGPCAYVVAHETASRDPQPVLSSTGETQAKWPPCMMPDGGECCPQYSALAAERDELKRENDAFWQTYDGMNVHQIFTGYTLLRDRAEKAEAERDALAADLRRATEAARSADERCQRYDRMVEQLVRVAEAAQEFVKTPKMDVQREFDALERSIDALPPGMLEDGRGSVSLE